MAMNLPEKKAMMQEIVAKVGREKAIELVAQSYNTELITTWLSRMEIDKPSLVAKSKSRDHLGDALGRVVSVCELTNDAR